jgi:hypothetical protein
MIVTQNTNTDHDGERVIVPCAGFGKRMGLNPQQSKEMLVDPLTGKRMIDQTLEKARGRLAVVVVRREKQDLIEHLQKHWPWVDILIVAPTPEWPASILETQKLWSARNVVILPDTRFEPNSVVDTLFARLTQVDAAFATFHVENAATWGVVKVSSSKNQQTPHGYRRGAGLGAEEGSPASGGVNDQLPRVTRRLDELESFRGTVHGSYAGERNNRKKPIDQVLRGCEKPFDAGAMTAWGLFGFTKAFGQQLLGAMLESTLSHQWYELEASAAAVPLSAFVDLTRPF